MTQFKRIVAISIACLALMACGNDPTNPKSYEKLIVDACIELMKAEYVYTKLESVEYIELKNQAEANAALDRIVGMRIPTTVESSYFGTKGHFYLAWVDVYGGQCEWLIIPAHSSARLAHIRSGGEEFSNAEYKAKLRRSGKFPEHALEIDGSVKLR